VRGELLADINNHLKNSYNYDSNPAKFEGPFTILNTPSAPNPQFTPDFSRAHAFRLQSNSPSIDAGSNVPDVGFDMEGIARPQGSGYDIGAFEFSNSIVDIIDSKVNVFRKPLPISSWVWLGSCHTVSGQPCSKYMSRAQSMMTRTRLPFVHYLNKNNRRIP